MEPDLSYEEVARRKGEDAHFYIPLEKGVDSLVWTTCANDGAVESGKLYYCRKEHSF